MSENKKVRAGRFHAMDLTGMRFGRLVAIKPDGRMYNHAAWLCRCDCGNFRRHVVNDLTSGRIISCGCYQREQVGKRMRAQKTTHGGRRTRLYTVWASMKRRCSSMTCKEYHLYGGRGIKVCEEWMDFEKFRKWANEHGYVENADRGSCTLDRINVDGDYCPDNCRWVDQKTQSNNRRKQKWIEIDGIVKTLSEWADISGISYSTIQYRLGKGWDAKKAIFQPSKKENGK